MNHEEVAGAVDVSSWDNLSGAYDELAARPLESDVAAWLADWSRFSESVMEAAAWLSIRRSQDTTDEAAKSAYLHYVREVAPKIQEAENGLRRRLVDAGFDDPRMATVLRQFRADIDLFREENLALIAEERSLSSKYGEIVGGLTVAFDGEDRTLAQLAPYRANPDRSVREAAWRAGADAMLGVRAELDSLFDELLGLRRTIAANAGFGTYTEYRWRQLGRFDYSIEDAESFHTAIAQSAVPALERAAARRAEALGVDALRPWDQEVDPWGTSPLRPFSTGDELASRSAAVFDALDPELGEMVRTMHEEGLLDLENRKGKAPGGYCATLHSARRPFIFMNAVGTEDNVRTMLHEAGHAFHVFDRSTLPYVWQRGAPMEFAEVASMSMELLTSPYIGTEYGGFYDRTDAYRSRLQHLDRMLWFLPYMACVSAFQHELYSAGDLSHADRDGLWRRLYLRYNVGADWSGLDETLDSLWHHKLHIFTVPFYYIEYGLAQMGALQVWRQSLSDPRQALDDYRAALALGQTVPLPDLFRRAGADLVFGDESVGELIGLVEDHYAAASEALRAE
jgi:oligoendopeptidase F